MSRAHHDRLHVEAEGPPWATPLVMLHGFTQSSACWGPVRDELAIERHLKLIDLPGHGASGGVRADFTTAVQLVGEAGGHGTYLGYSMGGRLALGVATRMPHLVQRLALVSAGPGIADEGARSARVASDAALADRIEEIGVAAFLDEWLAQPMFAGLTGTAADREARLANTAEGLASSLRGFGAGSQPDLRPELATIEVPVLLVTGALDETYTALAHEMADAIGDGARVVTVPDAGHAVHLEQPAAFTEALCAWLHDTH